MDEGIVPSKTSLHPTTAVLLLLLLLPSMLYVCLPVATLPDSSGPGLDHTQARQRLTRLPPLRQAHVYVKKKREHRHANLDPGFLPGTITFSYFLTMLARVYEAGQDLKPSKPSFPPPPSFCMQMVQEKEPSILVAPLHQFAEVFLLPYGPQPFPSKKKALHMLIFHRNVHCCCLLPFDIVIRYVSSVPVALAGDPHLNDREAYLFRHSDSYSTGSMKKNIKKKRNLYRASPRHCSHIFLRANIAE